jgi:hypothetical protein
MANGESVGASEVPDFREKALRRKTRFAFADALVELDDVVTFGGFQFEIYRF